MGHIALWNPAKRANQTASGPVEGSFDTVTLDHCDDLLFWIAQPIAFQKNANLLLHPLDLPTCRHLATSELEHPNVSVIILAFDLSDIKPGLRQWVSWQW